MIDQSKWEPTDPSGWGPEIDLSGDPWDAAAKFDNELNSIKANSTQATMLEPLGHHLGTLGEYTVALSPFGRRFGLKVNTEVHAEGDGYFDFTKYQITMDSKATTHFDKPWLREMIDAKKHADFFILVALDMKRQIGQIRGWTPKSILIRRATWLYVADKEDRYFGKRYVIKHWNDKDQCWDKRIRPISELEAILMEAAKEVA